MSNTPNPSERGRFSAPHKAATVLRLLRGESLELLSRELGVTAATLAGWCDDFLAGGQAALKSRPAYDRDEEIARMRAKVSSPSFIREPEGNGVAERFIRTLKENLPWVQHFASVAELARPCGSSSGDTTING
jgi:transposase-like protein